MSGSIDSRWSKGSFDEFLDHDDTPSDYTGEAGKAVLVNTAEDGLEFGVAGTSEDDVVAYALML